VSEPQPAFRCAEAARLRADPAAGSAPQADRWLLLEHPGPWPVDAVAGAGIDPAVLADLQQAAARAATRILLIRRPGRGDRKAARHWMLTGPSLGMVSGPWTEDRDLRAAADALAADPAGEVSAPIMLVCTHGVHDACCAIRGRPVAAALAVEWPGQVWECSHVGGDRFAPNLVMLPEGFYYGNLDAESAVRTVRQHLAGAVEAGPLRGIARFPPPVQTAVVAAYDRLGPLAPDAVTVESVTQVGPHHDHGSETTVELSVDSLGRVRVEVLAVRRPAAQLTCRADRETPATEYRIESFEVLPLKTADKRQV
jgi:(2Fe-2S) ferredoxin